MRNENTECAFPFEPLSLNRFLMNLELGLESRLAPYSETSNSVITAQIRRER